MPEEHGIFTFNMVKPLDDYRHCLAILDGAEVLVDPYVACVWGYAHFEKGEATFEGHWWESDDGTKVFLPRRQIFDNNLCANCRKELI